MRARWMANLLLLLLVIGLGGAMQWELERAQRLETLTGLHPRGIAEIVLERSGSPTIRLSKGADGWRMEAPYGVPADGERIGELVRIAATPVHRSFPRTGGGERFGLHPERLRLSLDGLVLRFGDTAPIGGQRYVAIDQQVHLIGDGFHHHLLARAEDYIDPRLLPAGFHPDAGTLDGTPLSQEQLRLLDGLEAGAVEPLADELYGRLLSLATAGGARSLRFLVSRDGRRWTRLDLRLSYLLDAPPSWTIAEDDRGQGAGRIPAGDLGW
jgi:hypothetical protein